MYSPEQIFTTELFINILLSMHLFSNLSFMLGKLLGHHLRFCRTCDTASPSTLDQLYNAYHGSLVSHDRIAHCVWVGEKGKLKISMVTAK